MSDKDARWPLLPLDPADRRDRLCRPAGAAGAGRARLPRARRGAGKASRPASRRDRDRNDRHDAGHLWPKAPRWWADACRGVDTVIHVAWYAEPGQYLQSPKNLDCLARHAAARAGREPRQGPPLRRHRHLLRIRPQRGPSERRDAAASRRRPMPPAKAAAFMALSQLLPQQGIEFAWCRLFYLYGEGEDARRLVPYLRGQARGRRAGRADQRHADPRLPRRARGRAA